MAKQAKLPERKLRAIQELKKRAIAVLGEEKAEKLLLQIRHSELSIAKAKRILNKVEAEAKLRAAMAAPVPATEAVDLRVCSMQDLLESVENIDAIITDPPYPKEYLGLYGELGRLAAKALKPGGILAVMCGQSYLPQLLADMSKHMKYRWTIAYLIPGGQAVQLWDRKVNTFWKPILIFGGQPRWLGDVVKSDVNNNDKRFHAWGQSESGVRRLIECLTEPGQLVCDPFLGAGTTAVACAKLARRIVGCDIDELQVEKARSRVKLERLDGDHRQTNIGCGRHIGAYPCCTCIRGDAENLLAGLPPRSVDAVVSDPPYGLDAAAWDRKVPYHLLERFLQVASGTVLWFGAAPAVAQAYTTFDPKPERLLIWSPSFTLSHVIANDLAYRFHALYAWRLPQKHNGPTWDILTTPTERGNWWKHSGTKPLELMRQLVGMVPKNGTILDPFAGSGTTLLAARDRGRHFLGFEINTQHCEVIRHRLYPNTTEAQAFVMASCQRSSACAYSGCVAPGFCSRAK